MAALLSNPVVLIAVVVGVVMLFRNGGISLPKIVAPQPQSLRLRDTLRSVVEELRANEELAELLRFFVAKAQSLKEEKK